MSAINFPPSPQVNDVYSINGYSWQWDGTVWRGYNSAFHDTTNASNIVSGVLSASLGGAGYTNGLLKANGSGHVSAAVAKTDYAPATYATTILAGDGVGGFSNVTVGTGLSYYSGVLTNTVTAASGPQGIQGIQGITGVQGTAGFVGSNGSQGIQGIQGTTGSQGTAGFVGSNGSQGTQGIQGYQGITGAAGQSSSYYNYLTYTGSTSGDPGSGHILWNNAVHASATALDISFLTSTSVDITVFLGLLKDQDRLTIQDSDNSPSYQTWKVNGTPTKYSTYIQVPVTLISSGGEGSTSFGSEDQIILIISNVGNQGIQGSTGTQGITGAQGVQGIQGQAIQGIQGITGSQGIQGSAGAVGNQGIQGIQGTQGIQGIQGQAIQGTTGLTGPIGYQGVQGIQGTTGSQGTQGIQGITGSQGIQGIQGTTGSNGSQGIQGIQGQAIQGTTGAQGSQGIQGIQGIQGNGGSSGAQGTSGASILGTTNTWTGASNTFNNTIIAGSAQINNGTALIDLNSTTRLKINSISTNNSVEFWKDSTPSYAASIGLAPAGITTPQSALVFTGYPSGSWVEQMRLTSGGNLGLGTNNPSLASGGTGLQITNSTYTQARLSSSGSSAGLEFNPSSAHNWEFQATNDPSFILYDRGAGKYRFVVRGDTGNTTIGYNSAGDAGYNLYVPGNIGTNGIIYDNANTAYYVQPSSFSNLLTLRVGNRIVRQTTTIDMSNTSTYSTSNFYPVTIQLDPAYTTRIRIENALSSNVPSWSAHPSGFTLILDWEVNGYGWGTSPVLRRIHSYVEAWTNSTICGGISQLGTSSEEVVWLRGGGQYYFSVSGLYNNTGLAIPIPHSTTYTAQSGVGTAAVSSTAFNNPYQAVSGVGLGCYSFYAVNYYDQNNSYYLQPGGTSSLNAANFAGAISFPGGSTIATNGDINSRRSNGTSGVYYFASNGSNYLYYDGTGYIFGSGGSFVTVSGDIRATGNITAYYSDERLKDIEGNIPNALDKVRSLNGFYYTANDTAVALGYKKKRELGVSAQEVEKILPELIEIAPISQKKSSPNEDEAVDTNIPEYKTLDYGRLVPLLIEAIKELTARVEQLENSSSNK